MEIKWGPQKENPDTSQADESWNRGTNFEEVASTPWRTCQSGNLVAHGNETTQSTQQPESSLTVGVDNQHRSGSDKQIYLPVSDFSAM